MKIRIIFFLICFAPFCFNNQAVDLLKQEVNNLGRNLPSDSSLYIHSIQTNGDLRYTSFNLQEFESKMVEMGIEDKAREKLRGIVFSRSIVFQGFSLVVTSRVGVINEIIGLARNNKGVVELAFINTESFGYTIPKYVEYMERRCETILFFWEQCYHIRINIPRGFYANEIFTIEETLRYYSFDYIKSKFDEVSNLRTMVNPSEESDIPSRNGRRFQMLNNINTYGNAISEVLEAFSSNKYIQIVKENLDQIYEGILINHHNDLKAEEIKPLLKIFKLEIPNNQHFSILYLIDKTIKSLSNVNNYGVVRIAVGNKNKALFLYEFFIRYSDTEKEYDIEIRTIKTYVQEALDSVLVKQNDDTYVSTDDDVAFTGEMRIIFNVLEVISQKKSEEVRNNTPPTPTPTIPLPLPIPSPSTPPLLMRKKKSQTTGFESLASSFARVTNVWGNYIDRFKSTRSSQVKDKLLGEGFKKFDETAQVQIVAGMKKEGFESFFALIAKRMNIPDEKKEDVKSILEETEWIDSNTWASIDMAFSIEEGGKVKYASIFSHRDENDKFFFVITEVNAQFELMPDIFVLTQKLSVLGGLWTESVDRIKIIPHSMTADDMKTVFSFFELIVFKQVANQFGINLDLPKK